MAESFGNEFTLVEAADDTGERQLWVALAKPGQALTLVLAAVPEGWTTELSSARPTEEAQRMFCELNLKPGDVYRLP